MKTEYRKWLSEKLIELRTESKKTQNQRAAELGIKVRTYQSYEEGRAQAPLNVIVKVCQLHEITVDIFLLGSPMQIDGVNN